MGDRKICNHLLINLVICATIRNDGKTYTLYRVLKRKQLGKTMFNEDLEFECNP